MKRPPSRSLLRVRSLGCALRRPDLVRKLVLMGLYVNRDGEVEWFGRYVRDATAAVVPESLRRAYEERSPDGAEHFDVVAEKILHLWRTEPDLPIDALRELSVPTLLLQGDADIVTLEHGVACDLRRAARGGPRDEPHCALREAGARGAAVPRLPRRRAPAPAVHRRGPGSLIP